MFLPVLTKKVFSCTLEFIIIINGPQYLEMTAKSKAKQADVDKLADEVNRKWWAKNKKRLLGA